MKGASTGLNLTPREYLEMLTEEYRDYQEEWHANQYKVSMRKAINCCGLSNAMPEIIFVHYGRTDPEKVHRVKNEDAYRKHLRCPSEIAVIGSPIQRNEPPQNNRIRRLAASFPLDSRLPAPA
jgi:hypothetical protein